MGCDATEPQRDPLVVQAFAETGQPLPEVLVRRAGRISGAPAGLPVSDADVRVRVGGAAVGYRAEGEAGRYVPEAAGLLRSGMAFSVEVRDGGEVATAASVLPPGVVLDSVRVLPAAAPVEAVFADSLGLDLREGVLYPVNVRVYWRAAAGAPDSLRWVRLQLRPPAAFPSAVVDFLLRTDETTHEDSLAAPPGKAGARVWVGVYAVPVETLEDALPAHRVRIALVRSGLDYARYARSREDPDNREPIGNVRGGLGIVAGIALDTLTVEVRR